MNILVIYHNNCLDGLTAAYICAKELSFGNTVQFMPYNYGVKAPHLIGFTDVYIVDFSFPKDEMLYLLLENPSIHFTVIDHHSTAECLKSIMLDNFTFRFDNRYCGAMLTWKYFHPECSFNCAPLFLQYIQDRDLWKWELPNSKAINAYIRSLKPTMELLGHLITDFRDDFILKQYALRGLVILEDETNYIREAIKEVKYLNFLGLGYSDIPFVKVGKLASETIEALYKQENTPFAIGWREWEEEQIKLEFRSDGKTDVSLIAKHFGGGGHRSASGCQISITQAKELGIL